MKLNRKIYLLTGLIAFAASRVTADDITTLDGKKYSDVKDVMAKPKGLFFVVGTGAAMRGAMVPYTNLPDEYKEKYHYDPYELNMKLARENRPLRLTKNLAFSLATLDQAKAKAKAEKKLIGFILVWDSFFVDAPPMEQGSDCGLAHFYYVFHDNVVLVFVHHETELNSVPATVKIGFLGPEEGGFAPNMCVVNSDCSEYVCEIPYGGDHSNGAIREKIFRDKIAVMKKYVKDHPPQ